MTHETGEDGQMPGLVKKIAGIEEGGPIEYEGVAPDGETSQEGIGGKRFLSYREANLTKEMDDAVDKQWLCHEKARTRRVETDVMASYVL